MYYLWNSITFRMLEQIEMRVIDFVYSVMSWKLFQMPLSWQNGKMSVINCGSVRVYNAIICTINIIHSIYFMNQICRQIRQKNINGVIINMIFVLCSSTHFVYRINIFISKTEISRVINQTLSINSTWGKSVLKNIT